MQKLVFTENGQVLTSSKTVAESFEMEHKNVLQAIDNLVAENSAAKFFAETTYENRGKEYRMYAMTRDGFTLLAMGFTGKKALEFKIKYIEAFNQMEKELKQPKLSNPEDQHIKLLRAEAMLKNAETRKAKLLQELSKDATTEVNKVLLQDKAVEVLTGQKLLEVPALREKMLTAEEIAKQCGVMSKSGNPHGTAVSQLIQTYFVLADDEIAIFPESKGHWSGSVVKYTASVLEKVRDWLKEHDYPSVINSGNKSYHVNYVLEV